MLRLLGNLQINEHDYNGEECSLTDTKDGLSNLLVQILSEFDIETEISMDEVVVRADHENIISISKIVRYDSRLAFNYLRCLSAVDYTDRLEVVYHLFSLEKRQKLILKISLSPKDPRVPSIVSVWPSSNWFEREAHDLYGIEFEDHPSLSPLLLYDGFEGHPGLKSFPFHEYNEW